jgi:hypothetical protein
MSRNVGMYTKVDKSGGFLNMLFSMVAIKVANEVSNAVVDTGKKLLKNALKNPSEKKVGGDGK